MEVLGGAEQNTSSFKPLTTSSDDNRSSTNLISIDYAEAFNRMAHQHCLNAFHSKGGSQNTLNLIYAFLSGRRMQVKVGKHLSSPRPIFGGSPQGCVTANALFCATIEYLQSGCLEESVAEADLATAPLSGNDGLVIYANGTILFDVPSTEESEKYFTPFEYNGIETESDDDFLPRLSSSPRPGHAATHLLSHCENESTLSFRIETDSPIQRPCAGRKLPMGHN